MGAGILCIPVTLHFIPEFWSRCIRFWCHCLSFNPLSSRCTHWPFVGGHTVLGYRGLVVYGRSFFYSSALWYVAIELLQTFSHFTMEVGDLLKFKTSARFFFSPPTVACWVISLCWHTALTLISLPTSLTPVYWNLNTPTPSSARTWGSREPSCWESRECKLSV